MIINNNGNEVIILSDGERKEMNISAAQEVQDHIIKVLTDHSYQKKIESVIREAVANSVDSNIEAGKKTAPVYVRFKRNSLGRWYFETEDQGLGLDKDGFDKYIMGIGESTKRDNPETFGYFGGGAKAPLCKVNSFDWICRKDGIERKFTIFKTNTRPNREVIYEQPTDKPNGCVVHIDIPVNESINQWKNAMKEQLAYLPYLVFDVDGETTDWNNYKIFQAEHFEMRELTIGKEMHISLGGIYYPIDWSALGISPIYLPVALRFGLDEGVAPIFSREALQYNPVTVELIKNKITKVAEWFRDYYNNSVKSFDTFWEAYHHIDQPTKTVELNGHSFTINFLMEYARIKVKEPEVKGVDNKRLVGYKKNFTSFFSDYKSVAQTKDYGKVTWITNKGYNGVGYSFGSKKIVLVKELPIGNYRDFLKEKFGNNTLFVIKHFQKRKLLKSTSIGQNDFLQSYHYVLGLKNYPKDQWRDIIKEWQMVQKQLTSTFLDGDLKDSQEFADFIEEKKEQERERRRVLGKPSDTLGKQKGQVTIGTIRAATYTGKPTYDREAMDVEKLERLKNLVVYFIWEEGKEKWETIREFKEMFPGVWFIGMNQSEIKLIKHIYQFKTMEEFVKARPFARAVTSIAIKKYLDKIPSSEQMLYLAFPKYGEMKERLKEYVTQNEQDVTDDFAEELYEIATANNNWDMNIYPEFLEFKKIMDDFQFLNYFRDVDTMYSWQENEKKMIKTLVYVFTRDRKIENNLLHEYELINHANPKQEEFDYWRPETDSGGYVIGYKTKYGREDEWIADDEAWSSKEALLEKYPGCTPIGYKKGTREKLDWQDINMEMKVA